MMSQAAMIHEILSNSALRAELFPITTRKKFFAHAAVAPLSGPAARAVHTEVEASSYDSQERSDFWPRLKRSRETAAKILNVQAEEISLLGPTALGLSLVALGLKWEPGDEVVYYPGCYPANVYPWLQLASRGVKPVALQPERLGEITPELVLAALSSHTKLVSLASCHFLTGYRIDYHAIGEELRRRGILFCLDAIQTVGAQPLDANCCDFLSADAHKWMLGPNGAGIFYVRESAAELLEPALLGAWNVDCPNFIAQPEIRFEKGARRFEPGSLNNLGNDGVTSSLELLQQIGLPAIAERLLVLRDRLVEGLLARDWTVLSATHPRSAHSGIVSCRKERTDLVSLTRKLREENFALSLRYLPDGSPFLRFSPHFYNLESEIDELLLALV
jgi:selenocysteine lyase/cysteine desulfurase